MWPLSSNSHGNRCVLVCVLFNSYPKLVQSSSYGLDDIDALRYAVKFQRRFSSRLCMKIHKEKSSLNDQTWIAVAIAEEILSSPPSRNLVRNQERSSSSWLGHKRLLRASGSLPSLRSRVQIPATASIYPHTCQLKDPISEAGFRIFMWHLYCLFTGFIFAYTRCG
jgi:hypothetical protein